MAEKVQCVPGGHQEISIDKCLLVQHLWILSLLRPCSNSDNGQHCKVVPRDMR